MFQTKSNKLKTKKAISKIIAFLIIPTIMIPFYFLFKYFMKPKKTDFWAEIKHFAPHEFDQRGDKGSGKKYMVKDVIEKIDKARELAGIPMSVNSGYRSPAYNLTNTNGNGVKNSAHTVGKAVDIRYKNESDYWTMLNAFKSVGFVRIGHYLTGWNGKGSGFIHVDVSTIKPQVNWYKLGKTKVSKGNFNKKMLSYGNS